MKRAAPGLTTLTRHASQRLWLARAIAWALLLGGWLVLGTLGRQYLPQVAGGQVPVALWLATAGGAQALVGRWRWSAPALRSVLLVTGIAAATALALRGRTPAGVLCAAAAWALLLVAVSLAVRSLRRLQHGLPPAPIGPALAGACLAWAVAGDLGLLRHAVAPVVLALGLAALALAWLLPCPAADATPASTSTDVAEDVGQDDACGRRGGGFGGCPAGLFGCALPLLQPGRWRHPVAWPQAAAALTMLPMMASLPAMDDWCGDLRWPATAGTALHLGVMVLPAALLQGCRIPLQGLQRWVALLLALGGAALGWPGLSGLMAASLLHGLAWSVASAATLAPRVGQPGAAAVVEPDGALHCAGAGAVRPTVARTALAVPAGPVMWGAALLTASAVMLLGQAVAQFGPAALVAVHASLAGLGLVGGLAGLGERRAPPQPLAKPG